MNITQIKLANALESNKQLSEALKKEKEKNAKAQEVLAEVTAHNIALRAELKSVGGTFDITG